MKRVLIIGAGASGLMAAIHAAENGAAVTILDRNAQPGKKILASGNGRCNLTNRTITDTSWRGHDPAFAYEVLKAWSVEDTLNMFDRLGLVLKDQEGWIYPYAGQSQAVLAALLDACARLKVKIKTNEEVVSVTKEGDLFQVITAGWHYEADALIIAAGSPASEVSGASDFGFSCAQAFGHTVYPPLPALTVLRSGDRLISGWGGARVQATATLCINGETILDRTGQIQTINGGISGIPIFQLSRYAAEALADGQAVTLMLDLMPDHDLESLTALLTHLQAVKGEGESVTAILKGLLPDKLIPVFKKLEFAALPRVMKQFFLIITGTGSLKQAQVAAGGVKTEEVDALTCRSRLVDDLYITGECLDIDGDCGGYNLQFAWATGALAGQAAARE
ncbi:MAG: aminoacetone oxidase family FAD-binding enzyme [Lachnospiraceae bacterium]|nr:aminoacetone oxidase family FAD-binding enzyme [Lachnospiraceae bacterium]